MGYLPGLLPLTALYVALTAYRDIRDNFAVELWSAVGYAEEPEIIGMSELPVAFGVMVALGLLLLIKDNRTALVLVHAFMAVGTALVGGLTFAYESQLIGPEVWMIGVGFGLYLAYVPYGCVLFDRLFAAVGAVGTAGFLIYVTDAFGYLGSVLLMLYKDLGAAEISWLQFFTTFSYGTSVLCTVCFWCRWSTSGGARPGRSPRPDAPGCALLGAQAQRAGAPCAGAQCAALALPLGLAFQTRVASAKPTIPMRIMDHGQALQLAGSVTGPVRLPASSNCSVGNTMP